MWIKRLKWEWFTLLVCGVLVILLVYVFIKHPSNPVYVYPPLSFRVDETLLGVSVESFALNMQMSMPKGWSRINPMVYSDVLSQRGYPFQETDLQKYLLHVFGAQDLKAACVVSHDDTMSLDLYLSKWSGLLEELYPSSEVLSTTFLKDRFVVHQFMVSTGELVHIKLVCESVDRPFFAVDYIVLKSVYAKSLRSIESSIGSIQVVNND